ncbi:MAG: glycoside hydrolase family 3 N-terminal domain-containing protein [Acidobacteriota bacterium]|nr:glycoside hydrolase family 3 N-terminal domain-containing protein [Acidobacteriota bacterium]
MTTLRRAAALFLGAGCLAAAGACRGNAGGERGLLPYRNPALPIERRVEDLLGRMTPAEKFRQLFMIPDDFGVDLNWFKDGLFGLQVGSSGRAGQDAQRLAYAPGADGRAMAEKLNAIQRRLAEQSRLGIPVIPFDEALHGLIRSGATSFPQAIGLAAAWDAGLMRDVASAVARETRSRGIRQVLSPVVNIARDVRWGRVEETYGEDPYLAARMAAAFVKAFETRGVIATPKHFAANVGDGGRDSYPIYDDERRLREVELPPFKAALTEGGARSIMSSYNSLDGSPASANDRLLNRLLKGEWAFRGFVVSDACAVGGSYSLHLTSGSYDESGLQAWRSGLDVIFQTAREHAGLFDKPILDGRLERARLDDAVRRVLRAKMELGLFENPYVDPAEAEKGNGNAAHRALARKAAEASVVLLKNEAGVLPLRRGTPLAVIGPDAVEARLGGYSGPGINKVSLLDGLRATARGGETVAYAAGCGRSRPRLRPVEASFLRTEPGPGGKSGLRAEYYSNIDLAGEPAARRVDPRVDFHWTFLPPAEGLGTDWYSVRWRGTLVGPADGSFELGVEANDGVRLFLDGRAIVDQWSKETRRALTRKVRLEKGRAYALNLEFHEPVRSGEIRLVWDYGVRDDSERMIEAAVRLAARSGAAVVAAGIEEGEARDRADIRLPGRQAEMIRRIAATGVPTVVVLYGGSAVEMTDWLDQADAVLDAWYPGEAGGEAVAAVLRGEVNPAGRLPITFPRSVAQLPLVYNHKPTGRVDDYLDLTGEPLFPFGFGLSYTTFRYSDLAVEPAAIPPSGRARVSFRLENTGSRAGDEVAQLYIHDPLASMARPILELKGFERIHLKPGEAKTVTFELGPAELAMLDKDLKEVVEPGDFQIYIGGSSRDIRLRGILKVDNHTP